MNVARQQPLFDSSKLFNSPETAPLKPIFQERFRNISRIMDCVGCEKCRVWGKVQTRGMGTALKILLSLNDELKEFEKNPDDPNNKRLLSRLEIVALLNGFGRISESLAALDKDFRSMFEHEMMIREHPVKRLYRTHRKRILGGSLIVLFFGVAFVFRRHSQAKHRMNSHKTKST